MISPIKHVLFEYCILLMKMALGAPAIASTNSNLCLMTNVKMLLGLNAIMPLLEEMHALIKISQLHDVFVCDFIAIVKICEKDVYMMYYDNHYYFQGDAFGNFHAFINNAHESMSFRWIMDLNIRTYHLSFKFVG